MSELTISRWQGNNPMVGVGPSAPPGHPTPATTLLSTGTQHVGPDGASEGGGALWIGSKDSSRTSPPPHPNNPPHSMSPENAVPGEDSAKKGRRTGDCGSGGTGAVAGGVLMVSPLTSGRVRRRGSGTSWTRGIWLTIPFSLWNTTGGPSSWDWRTGNAWMPWNRVLTLLQGLSPAR